jgi:hypothetical protein
MKSQLSKDGKTSGHSSLQSPADKSDDNKAQKSLFSPNGQSALNNYFPAKGPIKPASMLPTQAMINPGVMMMQNSKGFAMHSRPSDGYRQQAMEYYDEEDYGMEDDYDMEDEGLDASNQRLGGRELSPEEETHILQSLMNAANKNVEFIKVLQILQQDPELRPLIFEHEALLKTLKDVTELKAE